MIEREREEETASRSHEAALMSQPEVKTARVGLSKDTAEAATISLVAVQEVFNDT